MLSEGAVPGEQALSPPYSYPFFNFILFHNKQKYQNLKYCDIDHVYYYVGILSGLLQDRKREIILLILHIFSRPVPDRPARYCRYRRV